MTTSIIQRPSDEDDGGEAGHPSQSAQSAVGDVRAALELLESRFNTLLRQFEQPGSSQATVFEMADALNEVCLFADIAAGAYAKALTAVPDHVQTLEYSSVTGMLQHELGLKRARANDAAAVGTLLHDRRYPKLADAINEHLVSLGQGAQVVRALDDVAHEFDSDWVLQAEAVLTDFATGGEDRLPAKPERLRTLLQSWIADKDPERVTGQHEGQWKKRTCTMTIRDDGMISIHALLPPESGAAVFEYLDAHSSPRVRFTDLNDPNPTPADDGTGELIDTRTRGQKMADGFVRAFQSAAASTDAPTQGGAAPTLTVTIAADQLSRHASGRPALAELPRTGTMVPANIAARVACDGIIQAAVTGKGGEVLHLGRTQRLFSPKQKQALALTYKTCAAGGCDIPARWCANSTKRASRATRVRSRSGRTRRPRSDHHAIPWSHGGSTDLPDGILVCNFHHHQIHQDNLVVERSPGSKRLQVRRRNRRYRT